MTINLKLDKKFIILVISILSILAYTLMPIVRIFGMGMSLMMFYNDIYLLNYALGIFAVIFVGSIICHMLYNDAISAGMVKGCSVINGLLMIGLPAYYFIKTAGDSNEWVSELLNTFVNVGIGAYVAIICGIVSLVFGIVYMPKANNTETDAVEN